MAGNTACKTNGQSLPATTGGEIDGNMGGMEILPEDGSTTAVVCYAVSTQLDEETTARDHERAVRYVETVKPAMATQRYVHKSNVSNDGSERHGVGGATDQTTDTSVPQTVSGASAGVDDQRMNDVLTSEEGERMAVLVSQGEEGETDVRGMTAVGDEVSTSLSALKLVSELTDEIVEGLGTIGKVRTVVKRVRRESKHRRAMQAKHRAMVRDGGEVSREIAQLEQVQRDRRQEQVGDAQRALAARRQKRGSGDRVPEGERARVQLVQHHDAATTTNADEDDIADKRAAAGDGLPTAMMTVDGYHREVKIDSGARYCVAGTDWMMRGERVRKDAPVHCVEGIGGFLLDVIGVWTFSMRNVYGQTVQVDACIIDGCTSEFLVGVDFLEKHRATIDFDRGEVRYVERGHAVVIPFRTYGIKNGTTATVRLASATNLQFRTVQPVEVAVAAADGDEGIFLPTVEHGAVLLAAAVTKVKGGKALVPAINAYGGRVKLPSRKELGVWVPINSDMELLAMNDELEPAR
ncbi:hypothetical protein PHMEG_00034616, partial [Phytophthora megakarya]